MGEPESGQSRRRAIDCLPQMELGESVPLLELIQPLMVGNQLNKRYQWFLNKFSGLSVVHDYGLKHVTWPAVQEGPMLPFIHEIDQFIEYYEEYTDEGTLMAHARFGMPDYFLFDEKDEESDYISLLDFMGFYLFEEGIITGANNGLSADKDITLVLDSVFLSKHRTNAREWKTRIQNGRPTCLETSIIAGLTASLYPFYRTSGPFANNPIVDVQIMGVAGSNFLLGSEQDPLHYGVVILDSNNKRWLMLAGVQAYSETEISDAFKECKELRRNGNQNKELTYILRAQALGLKMINKSRLTM